MQVEVPRLPPEQLAAAPAASSQSGDEPAREPSERVRDRVEAARERQQSRAGKPNAALGAPEIERDCQLDDSGRALLVQALQRLALSARAYHRILKVARTIADLADRDAVGTAQLSEAVGYRRLDRGVSATPNSTGRTS